MNIMSIPITTIKVAIYSVGFMIIILYYMRISYVRSWRKRHLLRQPILERHVSKKFRLNRLYYTQL